MEAATTKGPSEDQLKALRTAIELIEREEGAGTIMKLDEAPQSLPSWSTGSLPLDIALGIGGIPQGRIVEIYGPESSGKTTFCYHVIASVQQAGGIAAFVDAEHAMDVKYAKDCGVDVQALVASQPDYGEQALKVVEKLVASGAVQVVVVDSVAALTPKAEIDGEIGDSFVGTQARLMSQALRKLAAEANRHNCTIIFTNQLREKIGVMFGSPETTPGGKALKFYCSVRLDIRRIETLKKGTEAYGSRVRVKVVKNKVAPPWRQCEFDVVYGRGFDRAGALIDLGVADKILTKSGAFFSYDRDGELIRLGQGKANAAEFLGAPENKELADEIDRKVRAIHLGQGHDAEDVTEVLGANVEDEPETPEALIDSAEAIAASA